MLRPGDTHSFDYTVTPERTVPHLLPESPEFAAIPPVFATGYMVAVVEWTAIQHLSPHLGEAQTSVGTHVDLSHEAPTPAGMKVTIDLQVTEVSERSVTWRVTGRDEAGTICRGTHSRGILDRERFERGVAKRAAAAVQKQ